MDIRAIFLFLLAFVSGRAPRAVVVYDTPSPIVSASLGEAVMASPAKEETYRFSAYVETQASPGCEYDTTADLVLSWVRITPGPKTPQGLPGWQRYRVTIRKDGQVKGTEIPASVFRVKAGSRISYHIEYSAGRGCKVRPSYQVFPVLERIGGKPE